MYTENYKTLLKEIKGLIWKGIMIEMDEEKLFSNDMVLYIEKLKESGKNRANEWVYQSCRIKN